MNDAHLTYLVTDEWRDVLRDLAFPFAFGSGGPAVLGADPLEIGSGPGLTTDLLRAELPRLTSLELDPSLATALAVRLAGANVDVVEGDATAMPFPDDRFTGVCSFTMLHHVPTVELQDRLFAEVARVLRPGGVFVANDSIGSAELAGFHDGDTYNPVDPDRLEGRLTAVGLVDVDVRTVAGRAWAVTAHAG